MARVWLWWSYGSCVSLAPLELTLWMNRQKCSCGRLMFRAHGQPSRSVLTGRNYKQYIMTHLTYPGILALFFSAVYILPQHCCTLSNSYFLPIGFDQTQHQDSGLLSVTFRARYLVSFLKINHQWWISLRHYYILDLIPNTKRYSKYYSIII